MDAKDLEPLADTKDVEFNESFYEYVRNNVESVPREVNLIGYRVVDALPLIDKIIDKTIVEGSLSLRIIHGHGTGRLKSAIRDHLKGFACVKRVCGADPKSGGDAITIVELG